MKKLFLSLLLIFTIQNSIESIHIFAEEKGDKAEIISVIEEVIKSFACQDLNGMMAHISSSYLGQIDNKIIDYNKFRTKMEEEFKQISKEFADVSCGKLRIIKFNLQDNKADLEIDFDCKGFNLDKLKEVEETGKKLVRLIKEDGIWRIAFWASPPPEMQR